MKTLLQIAKETGISKHTLLGRAKVLNIPKLGKTYIINEQDEKRLLDPTLHKVGKRAKKEREVN